MLTGARSFAAIAEYAHDTGRTILGTLGVGAVVPHACTIRRLLSDLDPDAVEAAMQAWVQAQLAQTPAPDGLAVHRKHLPLFTARCGQTWARASSRVNVQDRSAASTASGPSCCKASPIAAPRSRWTSPQARPRGRGDR